MYAVYIGKAVQTVNPGAGSVGTTALADNAVTLGKMASGTDGNIISYDASGNPVAVATGSSGQVLTSAGAGASPTFAAVPAPTSGIAASAIDSGTLADARIPDLNASKITAGTMAAARLGSGTASSSTVLYGDGTFKAEPGGAMVLLQSVSVTTTVGSVNFSNVFSDTYTNYFFVFWNVLNGINNQPFHLRFKDTSNNTLTSSVYDFVQQGYSADLNVKSIGGQDNSSIQLSKDQSGGGPTAGKSAFTGVIYAPKVTSYASSDNRPTINWQAAYARSDKLNTVQGSGVFDDGTSVGGINLFGGGGGGPTYTDRFEGKIYGIVDS